MNVTPSITETNNHAPRSTEPSLMLQSNQRAPAQFTATRKNDVTGLQSLMCKSLHNVATHRNGRIGLDRSGDQVNRVDDRRPSDYVFVRMKLTAKRTSLNQRCQPAERHDHPFR